MIFGVLLPRPYQISHNVSLTEELVTAGAVALAHEEILATVGQIREGLVRDVHRARYARRLHMIRYGHVIAPHVVLPLAQAEHSAQDFARVHADAHVHVDAGRLAHLSYDLDHAQAHLDTIVRVVLSRDGQTRHAVVTIAQDLDSHTVVLLFKKEK